MTGTLAAAALALSGSLELSVAVKATIVTTFGLLGVLALRRACAARRYLVLAATFGVLAILPLAAAFAPPVRISVRETTQTSALPGALRVEGVLDASRDRVRQVAVEAGGPVAVAPPVLRLPTAATLFRAAWAVGAALFLMPLVLTLGQLHRLRRDGRPWPEGDARARQLALESGVRRPLVLLLHARVEAPMTFGLLRPTILFPDDARTWSDAEIGRALVHELEHVRRADWPAHLLARAVCALYWFHPLVWRAWRHLHVEADRACDDAVVAHGEGGAFAAQLVMLAQRISATRGSPVLSMASRGDLSTRVRAVLNTRQVRGRAGARWASAAAVLALAGAATLSPLTAVETRVPAATAADRQLETEVAPPPEVRASLPITSAPPLAAPPGNYRKPSRAQRARDAFETSTVRRGEGPTAGGGVAAPAGTAFVANNVTLEALVKWAYGIGIASPFEPHARWATIEGLPSWNDRFDVRGKAPAEPWEPPADTLSPMHAMVQGLLIERFNFVAHWETRPRPLYVLTLAVPNGGPQLSASTADCAARMAAQLQSLPFPAGSQEPRKVICGFGGRIGPDQRVLIGDRPLGELVAWLERELSRQVVDETGLAGNFDIELRYSRDPASSRGTSSPPRADWVWSVPGSVSQTGALTPPPPDRDWPPLEDALRDQLGLRLELRRAPDDVLVVDRVERPTLD